MKRRPAPAANAAESSSAQPPTSWWRRKLTDVIGLDPRSLAVFRIGLGLTLLLDLAIRAMDVRAMYAGDGILAIEQSIKMAGPMGWSLHWISGEVWFQSLLLGIAAVLALGMVLGYRTRWMVLGSYVLLASIQTRNHLVLNGGDGMFRVMLFWAIFLPLGAVWSLDARRLRRKGRARPLKPVVSVATFCLILQLCLVYWFAGAAKLNERWLGFDPSAAWEDPATLTSAAIGGDALERALNYDVYSKPLAGVLLHAPWLLRAVCISTLILELCGPILLFSPFGTRWLRLGVIASFALLHVGIEATLHVGMFTWVSLAAWAALLPPVFWEFRPLRGLSRTLGESPAASQLRDRLWWSWTKFFACQVIPSATCVVLMAIALAWNFSYSFDKDVKANIQRPIRPVVNATMLRQHWDMFGYPSATESWLVYEAKLQNGRIVDVFHGGGPVIMQKPDDLSATFTNHRWRKLDVNLCSSEYRFTKHRKNVADFLCRVWNESHSQQGQIVQLRLFKISERKHAPDECDATLCLTLHPQRELLVGDRKDAAGESPDLATSLR